MFSSSVRIAHCKKYQNLSYAYDTYPMVLEMIVLFHHPYPKAINFVFQYQLYILVVMIGLHTLVFNNSGHPDHMSELIFIFGPTPSKDFFIRRKKVYKTVPGIRLIFP